MQIRDILKKKKSWTNEMTIFSSFGVIFLKEIEEVRKKSNKYSNHLSLSSLK